MSKIFQQLKILLYKNYLLQIRNKLGSICEIIIPILFIYFFVLLKRGQPNVFQQSQTYINDLSITSDNYLLYYGLYLPQPLPISQLGPTGALNALTNHLKDCTYKVVGLAPLSQDTLNFQKWFFNQQIRSLIFKTSDDLDNYIQRDDYGRKIPSICFAIVINNADQNNWDYSLRFNVTSSSSSDLYQTQKQRVNFLGIERLIELTKYKYSGFYSIQLWIDNYILNKYSKGSILSEISSQKLPSYNQDLFAFIAQYNIDFFLLLPLVVLFSRMLYKVLIEKEKKIREGMRIMGMTQLSFYLSWYIQYSLSYIIVILIQCIIVKKQQKIISYILQSQNFFIMMILMFLFSQVLIFQSYTVSVFFTKAKPGLISGLVFFFCNLQVRFFLGQDYVPGYVLNLVSLSPFSSMYLGWKTMLQAQSIDQSLNFAQLTQNIQNYSLAQCMIFLFFHSIFWSLFALYLDQVFPNDFGKKQHPLFPFYFIRDLFFKKNIKSYKISKSQQQDVEQEHDEIKGQIKERVILQGLSKTYNNGKKAVDDLTLEMYLSQIFVLLGHNGAGKTSTIQMLIGMQEINEGKASIFGFDLKQQMDEIRNIIGYCPQHDILFDELTVKEHLEMFACFKGTPQSQVNYEVQKMIVDLDLVQKTNDYAMNLSGGQRRRLSTGIAFIGNSKLIILDEPTSGMDSSARRHIWEILKNFKNDRIILLTTHFMDEADYLGDRIGIMSQGKLKCLGSSVYLKNKYGIGYNLTIVKMNKYSNSQINQLLNDHIKNWQLLQDVGTELTYQLPMQEVCKFKDLFNDMDRKKQELEIQSYGVSITTLEEVFLKLTQEKNNDQQKEQQINDDQIEFYNFQDNKFKDQKKQFMSHFKSLILKRYQYSIKDKKGLICEIFLPIIIVIIGCLLAQITFYQIQNPITMSLDFYPQQNTIYSYNSSSTTQNDLNIFLKNFQTNLTLFDVSNSSDPIETWDNYLLQQRGKIVIIGYNNLGSYYLRQLDLKQNILQYITLFNTLAPEAGAVFSNQINQAFLRSAFNNSNFNLTVRQDPLPLTQGFKKNRARIQGFIASSIFAIAISFIPSSLIVYLVKESTLKIKHQQLVQGVGIKTYWFSNFCMDYFKYLIFALSSISIIQGFQLQTLSQSVSFIQTIINILLNGFSLLSFTYWFSMLFDSYGSAQVWIFLLYLLAGTVLSTLVYVVQSFALTYQLGYFLTHILKIFPPYLFGASLLDITAGSTLSSLNQQQWDVQSLSGNGQNIIYYISTAIFWGCLIIFMEFYQKTSMTKITKIENRQNLGDIDVQQEELLIQQSDPSQFNVFVDRLRKVYPNQKVAVESISMAIKPSEVFGLLGVNGAGKTTTFKMLTNDIQPTSGKAFINNYDLSYQQQQANQHIGKRFKKGYCPQFDGLLEYLTVYEHLQLYSGIQCMPYDIRDLVINFKIKQMDLLRYKNTLAIDLSGGNKRKLQVALATLGNPKVIFLDEPSTGMDPEARRFMWNVISHISNIHQSSIILTTHSMEEAEALCHRLVIMVKGQFRCLGSVQHIKSKYGDALEIELKTKPITKNDIIDEIKDIFGNQSFNRNSNDQNFHFVKNYNQNQLKFQDRFPQQNILLQEEQKIQKQKFYDQNKKEDLNIEQYQNYTDQPQFQQIRIKANIKTEENSERSIKLKDNNNYEQNQINQNDYQEFEMTSRYSNSEKELFSDIDPYLYPNQIQKQNSLVNLQQQQQQQQSDNHIQNDQNLNNSQTDFKINQKNNEKIKNQNLNKLEVVNIKNQNSLIYNQQNQDYDQILQQIINEDEILFYVDSEIKDKMVLDSNKLIVQAQQSTLKLYQLIEYKIQSKYGQKIQVIYKKIKNIQKIQLI